MMIEDKKIKQEILKELLKSMSSRVAKNDLEPIVEGKKTKMIIKAEGDSPEDVKEEVIKKLSNLELPEEPEMEESEDEGGECEECGGEGCPECVGGDSEAMGELPEGLKKMLMEGMKKKLKK